ncbi:LOW QUALITY PROTEIN: uncharacterized protein V5649_004889 [Rhynchonycteris naso]
MAQINCTQVKEFILMGLTNQKELKMPLFVLFLTIYLFTVIGNLGLILVIRTDAKLNTPMYFFLSNLALVDFCYTSVITPKMLGNFLYKQNVISFNACAAQLGCFLTFMVSECLLLASMAYDRYVAICNPLLYMVVMSPGICIQLVAIPYSYSFLMALFHTTLTFQLSYCHSNVINHFYCDDMPLLRLTCSDTHSKQLWIFACAGITFISSVLIVFVSYMFIISAILRMRSAEGRRKAFSTCGSHMLVVTIFYGTLIFMYLQPSSKHSLDMDKMASVFYTVIIPMLNPLIYSLRNKDVKDALKKVIFSRGPEIKHMAQVNCTQVKKFIHVGLTDRQDLKMPLFVLFLSIYLFTVIGNLDLILVIRTDAKLNTPMYFFLINLALIDFCYTSVITPKMLGNFLYKQNVISFNACAAQLSCFLAFMTAECLLLASMAYDRYVAICNPLLYMVVMSPGICIQLVAVPYTYSFLVALFHTILTFHLSYCHSKVINHFYCDDMPLLRLTCSDTHTKQLWIFACAGIMFSSSLLVVFVSYVYIISAILRMRSAEGRRKAFSTCGSHMVAITIQVYGTLIFMYLQPSSTSLDTNKMASVFYTVIIPMLNPLIYSLRNKDVKDTLKKVIIGRLSEN